MSDYTLINSSIKPPGSLPTLPVMLPAPLGITMRHGSPELSTISDNATLDALQCTSEIIKHQLNKELPSTVYRCIPASEIYAAAFKEKSELLKKGIDAYDPHEIAHEVIANIKQEVLPSLTHNEHISYDFDCLSGDLCDSHIDMLPSYDRRLQPATNKSIYSIGKPSESSDLMSLHKENEIKQFESYSNSTKSPGTIEQVASFQCPFSKELEEINEQPIDSTSIKQFAPMLTLRPKVISAVPKVSEIKPKADDSNIDILDELISIQSVLPKQVSAAQAIIPASTVSSKQSAITNFDQWAIEDNIDVKDYKALLPHPVMTFPFELDVFQKRSIIRVEQGHSVLVTAHTSAGKTVVAEYAISLAKSHLKKAIYTSPIKALSNQKYCDFKKKFTDVGILTGDISINPTAQCLIMTTEVLQSMLYRGAMITKDIECVIFDEVHYINDKERGYVWEECIILLPSHISIVMLSATVPNYLEFARWVGATKKKQVYIEITLKRPVPLTHFLFYDKSRKLIKDDKGFYENGYKEIDNLIKKESHHGKAFDMEKKKAIQSNRLKSIINQALDKKKTNTPSIKGFISFLEKQELFPTIFFCFSRNACENLFNSLSGNDLTTRAEKSKISAFFNSCTEKFKAQDIDIPQLHQLKHLIVNGIAYHHAGLLPIVKEMVEILFSQGLIKVLFATTTFAIGVNMPARTVVFSNLKKCNNGEFQYIESSEYQQMAGRAGRRGKDETGTVIIYIQRIQLKQKTGIYLQSQILKK